MKQTTHLIRLTWAIVVLTVIMILTVDPQISLAIYQSAYREIT